MFSFLQQVQKDLLSFMKLPSNPASDEYGQEPEDLGMAEMTLVSLTQESGKPNCFIKEKKKVWGKF